MLCKRPSAVTLSNKAAKSIAIGCGFDFTNQEALTEQQLEQIENICNERIKNGESISWKQVSLAEARAAGAMMLFGEKYPDPVSHGKHGRILP